MRWQGRRLKKRLYLIQNWLKLRTFDGFFKPTTDLSEFFSGGKDKSLFQNKDQDSTCIALAYLEIVMKDFGEEWELCYEKAQTPLDGLSGYDTNAIEKMVEDARKWIISGRLNYRVVK